MTSMRNAFFSTLILASAVGIPAAALAEDSQPAPRISVTGEGTATVAPDMAILTLTVAREADTARDALTANTAAMAEVLAAMKAEGIADKDLQTSGFSIEPRYIYPDPNSGDRNPPRIAGYTVRNSLTLRVRDLTKVGDILDKSVTLGVNQGGDVTFTNDDPSKTLEEARTKAMKNAIAKAKTLTEAAGIGLGKVMEISETSYQPMPQTLARVKSAMMEAADAAPVPMAAGENAYSVTVNVTFELKQ